ncbi:Uncharacterised protein [Mycobacteroides abscessus subsp. abscessus]|nr:Uncharacterised protein [Mycobacteroides abscessus subsp. abscessus]
MVGRQFLCVIATATQWRFPVTAGLACQAPADTDRDRYELIFRYSELLRC